MGFCTAEQSRALPRAWCPATEKAIVDSGIILVKYWLEVSADEQTRRLESRINDPRKIWKLSDMDLKSYSRWYDYSRARDAMLAATDTVVGAVVHRATTRTRSAAGSTSSRTCSAASRTSRSRCPRSSSRAGSRRATTRSRISRCATSRSGSESDGPPGQRRNGRTRGKSRVGIRPRPGYGIGDRWYALSPDEVAGRLGVDPDDGLAAAKATRTAAERTAPTRSRQRRPNRGGGASSSSTPPTCRSSCSSPVSCRSPSASGAPARCCCC